MLCISKDSNGKLAFIPVHVCTLGVATLFVHNVLCLFICSPIYFFTSRELLEHVPFNFVNFDLLPCVQV